MVDNAFQSKYTGQQIENLLDIVKELSPESAKDYELYCYKKCILDSNPFSRIYYEEDNKYYKPAGMDFVQDRFDYGDWGNAFFTKVKPVMLNYDGTIAYELDPNDCTKKLDGTDSDVSDINFAGNAMVGIPTTYIKRETIGVWSYVYISNKKIDDDYHAYAHTDTNGNIIDYFYHPSYNGSIQNNILRSISGLAPTTNTTATTEINAALKNNPSGENIWYTNVSADKQLINDLLILMGKSTNCQEIFGYGHYTGGSNASSLIKSGTMDKKGLFWGSNIPGVGVKVFGIENYWGNRWDRIAGYMYVNGVIKVKLTYGLEDGSNVTGYNQDGTGYIELPNSTISGTNGGYISRGYTNKYGFFPKIVSGSANTYECDGGWFANGIMYAFVGGSCDYGLLVGPLCVYLSVATSSSSWDVGASPSCKPKKQLIAA